MSAYKDLEALLGGSPLARKAIDAAFAEHAHELAEKVRALRSDDPAAEWHESVWNDVVDRCADEIDPEEDSNGR